MGFFSVLCAAPSATSAFITTSVFKLGEDGLLPATRFMSRVQQHLAHLTPWEKVIKVSEGNTHDN